jgi:TonB family protein
MKSIILVMLLVSPSIAHSQSGTTLYGCIDSVNFKPAEIPAIFPAGPLAWKNYVRRNLKYPIEAWNNNITGIVVVEFTVGRDGLVSDPRVFHSDDKALNEEALRIVKKSKWMPGIQNAGQISYRTREEVKFSFRN